MARIADIESASVQACITSPPYWGLRDYDHDEQLGLEPTPEEYTEKMVAVFREVRRVLRDDGTLWLNLGDSYATPKDVIRKSGLWYEKISDRGGRCLAPHPAVAIRNDAWKRLTAQLSKFGLTPSARSRLSIQPHETKSEFDKFLARKDYDPN